MKPASFCSGVLEQPAPRITANKGVMKAAPAWQAWRFAIGTLHAFIVTTKYTQCRLKAKTGDSGAMRNQFGVNGPTKSQSDTGADRQVEGALMLAGVFKVGYVLQEITQTLF